VRRRADAERSIEAIVEAALACFAESPDPSMSEIARGAGVGRVTLYAHFPSLGAVLEAVLDRTMGEAARTLHGERPDEGPAPEALARLLRAGWRILDRHRTVAAAAMRHLPPERLRAGHDPMMRVVERIVARGQAEGAFRSDAPAAWLAAVCYSLVHTAAQEVDAGRLAPADAPRVLESTLLSAFALPEPDSTDDTRIRPGSPLARWNPAQRAQPPS
jgi:AcrR family transcriptional regulator